MLGQCRCRSRQPVGEIIEAYGYGGLAECGALGV
jgi:hypothetical protein